MADKNVRKIVYVICYKLVLLICSIVAIRCCIQIGGIGNIIAGIFLIIMAFSDLIWILIDIAGFLYGRETAKDAFEQLSKETMYAMIDHPIELGEKSVKREDIEKK